MHAGLLQKQGALYEEAGGQVSATETHVSALHYHCILPSEGRAHTCTCTHPSVPML